MLDAPVEWVPGDRFWPATFYAIQAMLWGFMVSIAVVYIVYFGLWGLLPPVASWPFDSPATWQSLFDLISPWLFVALGASWWLIGLRPVAGSVGISRTGLTMRRIYRRHTVPWPEVRWGDATRIEIKAGNGFQRRVLTQQQVARIRHFFEQDSLH